MPTPSPAALRAFVRTNTRLLPVPGVPGLSLHQAADVNEMWCRTGELLGSADPPIPYWAFPWAGGLAVAAYLAEHRDEVAGRRVVDLASGSGLCAIAAVRFGAASVHAIDIDPFAEAAVGLNSRANGVHLSFSRDDPLDGPTPDCDLLIAGDVCYEEAMAGRMIGWLRASAARGSRVLLGDPGRAYLPDGLRLLATYKISAGHHLESSATHHSSVYTLDPETN